MNADDTEPALSILAAAADAPDAVGLVADGQPVTYRELAARAERTIGWLATRGIMRGDDRRVAVVAKSTPATIALLHALVELGVTAVLLHPRLTAAERASLVADCSPALLVSDADTEVVAAEPPSKRGGAIDAARVLAIVYTSGSSGRPKGVMLSRGAFLAAARANAANLGWSGDDRWLLCMPQGHVGGFSIVARCLVARRAVVIPSTSTVSRPFDPDAVMHSIHRDRVTIVSFVPTMLARVLEDDRLRFPPHVRAILLGGAPASPELLTRAAALGLPVLTTYGMSETCAQATTLRPGTPTDPSVGAGHPLPGVEIRIVDGAIHVRGPTLMTGYFPEGVHDTPIVDGWLRTGDLGRFDEHGRLHIIGRSNDLIITGGENVHPTEVEQVLERLPGIAAACVFSVPDPRWGEVVAAALVARGDALPPEELRAQLTSQLASHKVPRKVAWVPALALNSIGKLDRRATAASARPQLTPI